MPRDDNDILLFVQKFVEASKETVNFTSLWEGNPRDDGWILIKGALGAESVSLRHIITASLILNYMNVTNQNFSFLPWHSLDRLYQPPELHISSIVARQLLRNFPWYMPNVVLRLYRHLLMIQVIHWCIYSSLALKSWYDFIALQSWVCKSRPYGVKLHEPVCYLPLPCR